jgi:hypothetical protein
MMAMQSDPMGSTILAKVHEGMRVYDQANEEIGSVRDVFVGVVSEETLASGGGPATAPDEGVGAPMERVAEAFRPPRSMPDVLQQRLRRQGFIKIDSSGLFAADRYALADQIESVSEAGVRLRVTRDDLIAE